MDNPCNYAASRIFHVKNTDAFLDALSGIDIEVEVQNVDGVDEVYIYNEEGVWPGNDPDDMHLNRLPEADKNLLNIISQHLQPDSVAILESVKIRDTAYTEMQAVNSKGETYFTTNDITAAEIVERLGGNSRNKDR